MASAESGLKQCSGRNVETQLDIKHPLIPLMVQKVKVCGCIDACLQSLWRWYLHRVWLAMCESMLGVIFGLCANLKIIKTQFLNIEVFFFYIWLVCSVCFGSRCVFSLGLVCLKQSIRLQIFLMG